MVKFPHSPVLHYAFGSWIEKTITKNNTLPLVKQICFTIVWGCVEILPEAAIEDERRPKFGQPTLGNEVFERNQ